MTSILMRSWRNRQTRTVEGRVREGMGSSPFDRTIEKTVSFELTVFCFACIHADLRMISPIIPLQCLMELWDLFIMLFLRANSAIIKLTKRAMCQISIIYKLSIARKSNIKD